MAEHDTDDGGHRGNRVALPRGAQPPLRVFVNGVRQQEGVDFGVEGDHLVFTRKLAKERLGFWRWTAMFFAIFGSYGRNDTVDVHYRIGGRDQVATGLQIVAEGQGK
ncbi:MAG: hypothetical protein ACR2HC_10045 [Thermoleophilaceae bacterium]